MFSSATVAALLQVAAPSALPAGAPTSRPRDSLAALDSSDPRVAAAQYRAHAAREVAAERATSELALRQWRDGEAAERELRAEPYAAAVLDLGLPLLDGYAVCSALREAGLRDTRIVALTGYGREEDRRRALEAGFDAHLVKPVDPARLDELLRERTQA